jgi:hypothetical protein
VSARLIYDPISNQLICPHTALPRPSLYVRVTYWLSFDIFYDDIQNPKVSLTWNISLLDKVFRSVCSSSHNLSHCQVTKSFHVLICNWNFSKFRGTFSISSIKTLREIRSFRVYLCNNHMECFSLHRMADTKKTEVRTSHFQTTEGTDLTNINTVVLLLLLVLFLMLLLLLLYYCCCFMLLLSFLFYCCCYCCCF